MAETVEAELVGFGTWKHRDLTAGDQSYGRVIDIAYLGLVSKFKGEVDHDGYKLADRLYASVEEDAREHADSTDEMLVHLVCDIRNRRGLRFWERLGFEGIEVKPVPTIQVTYLRMIRA